MESKIRTRAISYAQRNGDTLKMLDTNAMIVQVFQDAFTDGAESQSPKTTDPKFVPVWHDNNPDEYIYFTEASAFIVYTEDEDGKGSYDLVCADCSGDEMELNFAYTGERFGFVWDQVIRFCLIEGKMPQKEIKE